MNKIRKAFIVLGMIFGLCAAAAAQTKVASSGTPAVRTVLIDDYNSFVCRSAIGVHIKKKAGNALTIKADKNILPYVEVRQEGMRIEVGIRAGVEVSRYAVEIVLPANDHTTYLAASEAAQIRSDVPLQGDEVVIKVESLGTIAAAAQAGRFLGEAETAGRLLLAVETDECRIECEESGDAACSIRARECTIEANNSAVIKGEMECREKCTIRATNSSKIELEGTAPRAELSAKTASKLLASGLYVADAEAHASEMALIELFFTSTLRAEAETAGEIRHAGPGTKISGQASTGGKIGRKN